MVGICRIHVYNFEDLILCSLPYHDTHAFVRIVQLIDTRWGDGFFVSHWKDTNSLVMFFFNFDFFFHFFFFLSRIWCRNGKWKFLDGVKASGAPPPRNVMVQQCVRDMGVLEALCNYVRVLIILHLSGFWLLSYCACFNYRMVCCRHLLQRSSSHQGLLSAFAQQWS